VSCGEIAAEEDCESERRRQGENRGNGKTQEEGKTEQIKFTVSTYSYTKKLQK